jgi:Xaa-Pro aminopeptidase
LDHALRRNRLVERLPDLGVDALVVSHPPNVRYLTGFSGSNGQALVSAAGSVFLTDGRYTEQSRREVPDLERVTYASKRLPAALLELCRRLGVERLGFESASVSHETWSTWSEALEGVELAPVTGTVERLRWVKDPEEVRLIELAQEATDQAFDALLGGLAVGLTERQVARLVEDAMHRAGADGVAFATIVAFGENAAEPHHEPTHRALREGDAIKVDMGAMVGGYHADMTRTIAFGAPPPELRKVHDVVREAQQAAMDALRAGVVGRDVDAAARNAIAGHGYEPFDHGLGHGVGLEIHEGPGLGTTSDDELPAGAVVTVEPGVYLPGVGGVRIEDVVEVTAEGCRPIPTSTRELIEL